MAKLKKRKDGRYQRKITLSDGRQRVVYGRTLAELNAAEDALRDQDNAGLQIGDHTLVGEWAKIWIESYKTGLRASTLRMYRGSYKQAHPARTGQHGAAGRSACTYPGGHAQYCHQSESTQHKVLLTMRQLFETARLNNLILRNPTDGIKPTPHARPARKEYLTPEEARTLMQCVTDPRARVFCALCLYCGFARKKLLVCNGRISGPPAWWWRGLSPSRTETSRSQHGTEKQGGTPGAADSGSTARRAGADTPHQCVCCPLPFRRRDDQHLL